MKRPLAVTIIGGLYLAAGVGGLVYHAGEWTAPGPFRYELLWVSLVRLLAVVCGLFLIRGKNWARWLVVLWITYHVILSAFHSLSQMCMHLLLLIIFAFFLFCPSANVYFRGGALNRLDRTAP